MTRYQLQNLGEGHFLYYSCNFSVCLKFQNNHPNENFVTSKQTNLIHSLAQSLLILALLTFRICGFFIRSWSGLGPSCALYEF